MVLELEGKGRGRWRCSILLGILLGEEGGCSYGDGFW